MRPRSVEVLAGVAAEHPDLPLRRPGQADEQPQHGRLAGAVRAEQRGDAGAERRSSRRRRRRRRRTTSTRGRAGSSAPGPAAGAGAGMATAGAPRSGSSRHHQAAVAPPHHAEAEHDPAEVHDPQQRRRRLAAACRARRRSAGRARTATPTRLKANSHSGAPTPLTSAPVIALVTSSRSSTRPGRRSALRSVRLDRPRDTRRVDAGDDGAGGHDLSQTTSTSSGPSGPRPCRTNGDEHQQRRPEGGDGEQAHHRGHLRQRGSSSRVSGEAR